jgi:hypothetical protein
MGTLTVEYLQNTGNTVTVPVAELERRIIQSYQAQYTGGEWNPDNNYNWVPGAFYDFTPRSTSSRIRFQMRMPHAWVAAAHAIANWRFFANGVLYYAWEESCQHAENAKLIEFDVPSWGTTSGRIGLQHRSHANDNNEYRMYCTYYWNGTGRSVQNSYGHMFIDEFEI